jgi:hypothetical protein
LYIHHFQKPRVDKENTKLPGHIKIQRWAYDSKGLIPKVLKKNTNSKPDLIKRGKELQKAASSFLLGGKNSHFNANILLHNFMYQISAYSVYFLNYICIQLFTIKNIFP